jgi:plastocyanin
MPPTPDRRTVLEHGALALASVSTAGCLGGGPPEDVTVAMVEGFAFDPETATVAAGGTATWENDSDVDHTVTAEAGAIPSGATYFASGGFDDEQSARTRMSEGVVEPGEQYSHTFEQAGTYEYYCIPHEGSGMTGTVEVE